jgi:hypothetical protein
MVVNKELAKKFHAKAYSRWANSNPIDAELFMKLVVDECIRVIEDTKGPSKIVAISNIRKYFGYPEQETVSDENLSV